MNKKFKLTDKVTKESIRSPEFKRWLMRILAVVCIISLIFQFSTCVYQGFSAYAIDDYGTYIINENPDMSSVSFSISFIDGRGNTYSRLYTSKVNKARCLYYGYPDGTYSAVIYKYADGSYSPATLEDRTITFLAPPSQSLLDWLSVNAAPVQQAVYDFTNEIRVFNDDLTFFITNSTTWTEAFNFNFEVIGVGTADYIVLQRDANNNYTMSYSYDFEGSGGLRTVYRFNHTTDTGGFFKENTKYIRFINNPENTDFQQWLLDNTTLVGTSDDSASFDTFYDMGFNVGYNSGYEQGFANSLIGDSLSGPINALSSITLIQIGDTVITLGGVIMTAIALCLVLAFLKLYAGG